MSHLNNKHILLAISGGIAAYKSAELLRRLQDAGAKVRVVMTRAATAFVTPLTFQALSGQPVHLDLLDSESEAAMGHIELARWADAILLAPATANTLAKLAHGRADDLVSAVCLASKAPLAVAPAMNHVMWSAEATQDNLRQLVDRGVHIFGPDAGYQACGETGEGRMLAVGDLLDRTAALFAPGPLQDINIMITAGPTYEAIDPVRFIGNRSSGRMGYALAQAAQQAGAHVTLVSGPVALPPPPGVTTIRVESARQMYDAVMSDIAQQAIFIATAAVADYTPAQTHDQKIKKSAEQLSIQLQRNPDILGEVAAQNRPPFSVGFAAETQDVQAHARAKLRQKKLDMIAANLVACNPADEEDIGFNSEYNALDVFWGEHHVHLEKARKTEIARQLMQLITEHYQLKNHSKSL
ncbi:MAG: bifunctional phosphopantothenoylcysteine decarboxylase/phosphopantothenate--cysteine ligase CoaBC [Gammaproteobacteria bacterium]|nr:bifunctional phosphopantothenoylcysteine decarboxylase/phosphopantothenate--cysteine ligase CoaBC [Gammaproteobacteria bacterium]